MTSQPPIRTWRTRRRELRRELLDAVGVADVEELFAQIPAGDRVQTPRRAAARAALRGRARAATCARTLAAQRHVRGDALVPRRRRLAAPRAGDLRRDRAAHRVRHLRVGDAGVRPRPQPGVVRVRQPARRAARAGLRRPARLQLGLRRRPRDPDGGADDRPRRGARPGRPRPRAAGRHPDLLRAAGARRPRSRSCRSRPTRRPAASTSPTSRPSSPSAPRRSTSRRPARSA